MSVPTKTHQLRLKQRPNADVPKWSSSLFELVEVDVAPLNDGEALVQATVFSCDPTQRIWVTDAPQYMPPVQVGEPMRSGFGGVVIASKSARFPVGANVGGFGYWAEHVVVHESNPLAGVVPAPIPVEVGVAASLCPETAYVGLFCIGNLRPGQTLLVNAAAGATGSAVVQMAKIIGATVIASAGGADKCAYVKSLGADHVIDYKAENFGRRLAEIAPGKIDFFFDNVGGEQLDAAMVQMALNGRIVICGAISEYENPSTRYGLKNYPMLLMRRVTMSGFIYADVPANLVTARAAISKWLVTGQLKIKLDISKGPLADLPKTVGKLFVGDNVGKTLHVLSSKL